MSTATEHNSTCACAEHLRAECEPGRTFRNAAGEYYCLRHFPGSRTIAPEEASDAFVCDCAEWHRSACAQQPFFGRYEGKDYCVLHYPALDKFEPFQAALAEKLAQEDYDFSGVWFPEANFSYTAFPAKTYFNDASFEARANFYGASFEAKANFFNASFKADAYFSAASFEAEAIFVNTSFEAEVYFGTTSFGAEADFGNASFAATAYFGAASFGAEANFRNASFAAQADFNDASFAAVSDFRHTSFKNYVRFSGSAERKAFGEKSRLDFQFVQIEKPELVSFHSLRLRPHWFINQDARKFDFVAVDWDYRLKEELQAAHNALIPAPHRLLAIAFRQLADNAEANHRYYEASRFRFDAFEMRRIEKSRKFVSWLRELRHWLVTGFKPWRLDWWYEHAHSFQPWRLDWWYWLASGYGERIFRATIAFIALLLLFAFGYTRSKFEPAGQPAAPPSKAAGQGAASATTNSPPITMGWREAALYSFNVSILQKPEPKPLYLGGKFLVALETILGPAQAALLALAVRRRFMR